MRAIQRGITTTFIISIILAAAVSITAVYFTYTLKQKISVNSFEACAKLYPVMESYPEQCQTPNGKHFTRQLSDEEKKNLIPPPKQSPSSKFVETTTIGSVGANWKMYKDEINKFSLEYPPDLHESGDQTQMFLVKNTATTAEKLSYSDQLVEIRVDKAVSRFNEYYNTLANQKVDGFGDYKIKNNLVDNNKAVEYGYDEALKEKELQLNKEALELGKSVGTVYFRRGLIINKQGTVIEISTNDYRGDFKQTFDKILATLQSL